MDDYCITRSDITKAKLCGSGARVWFASHNLSWTDLLRGQTKIGILRAFNDPLANKVIDVAIKRINLTKATNNG